MRSFNLSAFWGIRCFDLNLHRPEVRPENFVVLEVEIDAILHISRVLISAFMENLVVRFVDLRVRRVAVGYCKVDRNRLH